MNVLITGSSGQIGNRLCLKLKEQGHFVIGADIEEPNWERPNVFHLVDLRNQKKTEAIFDTHQIDIVYMLSAKMAGMGGIGNLSWSYDIMVGSTQQLANVLDNCVRKGIKKMFWASSACAYPENLQKYNIDVSLKESDAWEGRPDLIYGVQKLCGEVMCEAAMLTHGMDIKVARFHNVFGECGHYKDERAKAPAALSYKISMAKDGDEIEVWGDGRAKRSFIYVDEALEGVERLMASDYNKPLNIGSDESIRINDLAQMIIDISGKKLTIKNVEGNVGVQSRNSNNDLCEKVLGWKPSQPLVIGMIKLYNWIEKQVKNAN